jgi:hypothetical protein
MAKSILVGRDNNQAFHLLRILPVDRLENMLACIWIMDKGISLGPMDKLKMFCAWLAKY